MIRDVDSRICDKNAGVGNVVDLCARAGVPLRGTLPLSNTSSLSSARLPSPSPRVRIRRLRRLLQFSGQLRFRVCCLPVWWRTRPVSCELNLDQYHSQKARCSRCEKGRGVDYCSDLCDQTANTMHSNTSASLSHSGAARPVLRPCPSTFGYLDDLGHCPGATTRFYPTNQIQNTD